MAHEFDFRLPVLDDLPIDSALAEDRLGHYVEQWLAMGINTTASARGSIQSTQQATINLGFDHAATGSRPAPIVPDTGDIIPNPEQSELGQ